MVMLPWLNSKTTSHSSTPTSARTPGSQSLPLNPSALAGAHTTQLPFNPGSEVLKNSLDTYKQDSTLALKLSPNSGLIYTPTNHLLPFPAWVSQRAGTPALPQSPQESVARFARFLPGPGSRESRFA